MSEVDDIAHVIEDDDSRSNVEEEEKARSEEEKEEEEIMEEEEEEEEKEERNGSPNSTSPATNVEDQLESLKNQQKSQTTVQEQNTKEETEEDRMKTNNQTVEKQVDEELPNQSARSFDAMTLGPPPAREEGEEEQQEKNTSSSPIERKQQQQQQEKETERAKGNPSSAVVIGTTTAPSSSGSGNNTTSRENRVATVGEWNSLAVLVERLRSVLELSLAMASGTQLKEENSGKQDEAIAIATATTDTNIDNHRERRVTDDARGEQEQKKRRSMELQAPSPPQLPMLVNREKETDNLKKDLKFLEDLLMSDIHTALSRLKETLERIDVAALAKHGAASDTSSKLHLLQLVSSLLSRLEVTQEEQQSGSSVIVEASSFEQQSQHQSNRNNNGRRHRGNRHTIGVSSEELARARKWLEEERNFKETSSSLTKIERPTVFECVSNSSSVGGVGGGSGGGSGGDSDGSGGDSTTTVSPPSAVVEKRSDEIHDKNTKDAINHRQSLRDKSMDPSKSLDILCRIGTVAVVPFNNQKMTTVRESNHQQRSTKYDEATATDRPIKKFSVEYEKKLDCQNEMQSNNNNVNHVYEHMVETGRVGRLAAALQQRAECSTNEISCKYSSNRFAAKRSKIKRANTVDIPSYLKLQNESMKNEGGGTMGCVSLRKPIGVGDRTVTSNHFNNVIVPPSFQPKTENDRKFMALISKNTEQMPSLGVPPTFRTFNYTKSTDLSSVTNTNWNSRFSNIKTTFDKQTNGASDNDEPENQAFQKSRTTNKRAPIIPQVVQRYGLAKENVVYGGINNPNRMDSGFRHDPSSPFRSIQKPKVERASGASNKGVVPFACNAVESGGGPPIPGNALREKARLLFDQQQKCPHSKIRADEINEKRTFPRPAWMEQLQNGKTSSPCSGNAISENGRLDYRSFCKQFAPFVRKGSTNYEDQQQRNGKSCRQGNSEIVDGRISFNVISEPIRKNFVSSQHNHHYHHHHHENDEEEARIERVVKPKFAEATLRGYASVAVQTGADENTFDEARSFRVTPRIANCSPSSYNSVSIQTSLPSDFDFMHTVEKNMEHNKQRAKIIPSGVPVHDFSTLDQHVQMVRDNYVVPTKPQMEFKENQEETEEARNLNRQPIGQWNHEDNFLDARNIENQDITEEDGIITRYTCAIATVASTIDDPTKSAMNSNEEAADSRESSIPSVSVSPSWCWSKSRPTKEDNSIANEDEIRRHNILQQSLIQRLQHERCSMNTTNCIGKSNDHEFLPGETSPTITSNRSKTMTTPPRNNNTFLSVTTIATPITATTTPTTTAVKVINQVSSLREVYEQAKPTTTIGRDRSAISNNTINPVDSSDEYLMSCANKPSRSIVLSKSESWHQLALSSNSSPLAPRLSDLNSFKQNASPKPPKPRSPLSKLKNSSKQYEASSNSVKKMEDKIKRYFDTSNESSSPSSSSSLSSANESTRKRQSSPRGSAKYAIGLTRSRTMPGICEQNITLTIPPPPQISLLQVNSADLDKVFDDIFQEAMRNDDQQQQHRHC